MSKPPRRRRPFSYDEVTLLHQLYPRTAAADLARRFKRPVGSIYNAAHRYGMRKDLEFMVEQGRKRQKDPRCRVGRFPPGHVPFNKGAKGWQPGGRARETQFKKGNVSRRWRPEDYLVGTLRLNSYGYVDMKIKEGLRAWRAFHLILWEDAHGPLPKGFCLRFKDGDHLNIGLDNLELVSRADNMRRNTIHHLPKPIVNAIQLLGQLKRRIREKQDRGSAQSPVRDA